MSNSFWQREKRMKRWIAQVFEQRTFLGREIFEQKLLERWREDETRKFWKKWKKMLKDRMIERNDRSSLNSCHGHIFIISWWLKSKFVTLANFFKTSHLKKLWILKESSKTSHLKNCDFCKFIFRNQSLVIDYHQGVIDYTSTDVTLHD